MNSFGPVIMGRGNGGLGGYDEGCLCFPFVYGAQQIRGVSRLHSSLIQPQQTPEQISAKFDFSKLKQYCSYKSGQNLAQGLCNPQTVGVSLAVIVNYVLIVCAG